MNPIPVEAIQKAVGDARLQAAIYSSTGRLMDKRAHSIEPEEIDDFQGLRTQAHALKKHAIDHLDYYLEQLEQNVIARGGKVVWCRDGNEAVQFVIQLSKEKGVRRIVKSKSMTTEEIDLNEHLEH